RVAEGDAAEQVRRVRDRIPGADFGPLGEQTRGQDEARRLTQVVRARLVRESQERDLLAAQTAEVLLQLADDAPLLQLVDLDHRGQELELVAGAPRQLLERADVLREAATAVADAG